MNKTFAALMLLAALAPVLWADAITLTKPDGTPETFSGVQVTAWSWKEVSYKKAGGDSGKVARKDLIALVRTVQEGSMSENLSNAINKLETPAAARPLLEAETKSNNAVNKEEATYLLGEAALIESGGATAKLGPAITAYKGYLAAYKEGYYARQAYTQLARMQIQTGDGAGVRETYKAMARVGAGLDVLGHQALGEFEAGAKRWKEATAAFADAEKAAGDDKGALYRARAWQARVLIAGNDATKGKEMLEAIIKDEKFDDPNSSTDEEVLSLAYHAVADVYFGSNNYEAAYDAYVMAAFYDWWLGTTQQGYCLARAWRCAKKSSVGADKWKTRMEALEQTLGGQFRGDYDKARADEEAEAKKPG